MLPVTSVVVHHVTGNIQGGPVLAIRGLETGYGKVRILRGVDLTVADGAIVALLGGNGTGKSTLLKCVSGLLPAWSGSVEFDGQPISGLAPDRIVRLGLVQVTQSKDCVPAMTVEENLRLGAYTRRDRAGIARTFQLLRMFSEMTVLENLTVGHHVHGGYGALAAGLGLGRVRDEDARVRAQMMELLSTIGLADYAELPAADLSIGQRRLLALGRAMAMRPKLLLLDEPAAGLSPVNVDNLMRIVVALKDRHGLTVVTSSTSCGW